MMLLNDEPTQPTMREQIEALLADLNKSSISHRHNAEAKRIQERMEAALYHDTFAMVEESIIDRLRAILASPDAVSAEKGTVGRV